MAFTASAVWEVESGGSDTANGGGFDPGVSGFPTDGAATSANTSAPVLTSASYSFVAGDVGAWIYIKAGTNWTPGWYQIASVAGGAATLNGTIGQAFLATGQVSTLAGCATTASPTSGTWGIDYSQQAAAEIVFTDMVIGASTSTFTSVLNPVAKNMIGNVISVTSGTGFTVQRVAVVSTSGTVATVDKSLGTTLSTGGNGGLGGALASPGRSGALAIAGNTVFVKSATYTITSASTNIAVGCISNSAVIRWVGYNTIRVPTNTDTPATLKLAVSTGTIFSVANSGVVLNMILDGDNQTNSTATSGGTFIRCTLQNFKLNTTGNTLFLFCIATGNTLSGFSEGSGCYGCESYSNGNYGFNAMPVVGCLAYSNTLDGFQHNGFGVFINCCSYANGRDGFAPSSTTVVSILVNCHAENNTQYGYNPGAKTTALYSCSAYNNTSGAINTAVTPVQFPALIALSGSAFVNAASSNFALNATAAAGALLRATGFPATFPRGLTASYRDIGAAQHLDAGSGMLFIPNLEAM